MMPNVSLQFSTGRFIRTNGTLLNSIGIAVQVEVLWRIEQVRLGRDPDLEAARNRLLPGKP